MRTENLAYNVSHYIGRSLQSLKNDAASMLLEHEGITPVVMCATSKGTVVCPAYDGTTDVVDLCKGDREIDILEREETKRIKEIILSQDKPFISIWISSPDEKYNYESGRLQVGFGQKVGYLNVSTGYNITVGWSADNCLAVGNQLSALSGGQRFSSTNQLRVTPICLELPAGEKPLDFIAHQIDLPDVWQKIRSSEVVKMQEEAIADVNKVIDEEIHLRIQRAKTEEERRSIGAEIIEGLRSTGRDIDRDVCPGSFYSDSVTSFASFSCQVSENGVSLANSEFGVFCKECPYCHRTINAKIYPGYRCSCGQVFTGACGGGGQSMASGTEETTEDNPVINLIGLLFSFIFNL